MQLVFQNPLWFIAALIGVPLLAHLFSRSRPRRREFPSLRLLHEAMRQVTRVRQPRDRWLLLLRTLAMLALAAAFLQPWLMSHFASASGSSRTVVMLIDRTASMAYADGTRTRFAQATLAAAATPWIKPGLRQETQHRGSAPPDHALEFDFPTETVA